MNKFLCKLAIFMASSICTLMPVIVKKNGVAVACGRNSFILQQQNATKTDDQRAAKDKAESNQFIPAGNNGSDNLSFDQMWEKEAPEVLQRLCEQEERQKKQRAERAHEVQFKSAQGNQVVRILTIPGTLTRGPIQIHSGLKDESLACLLAQTILLADCPQIKPQKGIS